MCIYLRIDMCIDMCESSIHVRVCGCAAVRRCIERDACACTDEARIAVGMGMRMSYEFASSTSTSALIKEYTPCNNPCIIVDYQH